MSTADRRRRLAELDEAIVKQETAIDQLPRDLNNLKRERSDLQRELYASSTFPVLELPIEITAEIFSLCLPPIETQREELQEVDQAHMSQYLRRQAPTVFTAVCRTWRDIALGTLALWTMLYLPIDIIGPDVASRPGEVEGWIDRRLERAALRPLSIAVRMHGKYDEDYAGQFALSRVRNVIQQYAPRLEYLELDLSQQDMRRLDLDSVVFPLLHHAVLTSDLDHSNTVPIFHNAPQLCQLLLSGWAQFSYYTLPSLQLTVFEGEIDDLSIFTQAPNLTQARCSVEYLFPSPTSVTSHNRLQLLSLSRSYSGDYACDILTHLTLPALQTLYISQMDDSTYPNLQTFFTRSSPPLRTLSIRMDNEKFTDWAKCLSLVGHTLETLELESPFREVQLAIFQGNDMYNTNLRFPHLRNLSFIWVSCADYALLFQYLDDITAPPTKLRSFRLECSTGTFLDDEISVRSYIDRSYRYDSIISHLGRLAATRGVDIHISSDATTHLHHAHSVRASCYF
jgi:hypothetical protein